MKLTFSLWVYTNYTSCYRPHTYSLIHAYTFFVTYTVSPRVTIKQKMTDVSTLRLHMCTSYACEGRITDDNP